MKRDGDFSPSADEISKKQDLGKMNTNSDLTKFHPEGVNMDFLQTMRLEMEQKLKEGIQDLRGEMKSEIDSLTKRVGDLFVMSSESVSTLNFHGNFLQTINDKLRDMDEMIRSNEKKRQKDALNSRKTAYKLEKVSRDMQDYVRESKQRNIVINGLKETKSENTLITVITFLKNLIPDINSTHIEATYRLGLPGSAKSTRSIMVKFKDVNHKKEVMKKKSTLKDDKQLGRIFCNEDLPERMRKERQIIRETAKVAVKQGYKNVKCSGNKITIQGRFYAAQELFLLPENLKLENAKTRIANGILYFESDFSYLSTGYSAPFEVNGVHFSNVDQAYAYHKAIMCGGDDVGPNILECEDTQDVRRLCAKIDSNKEWAEKRLRILKGILIFKFQQNEDLRQKFCQTGDAQLLNCDTDMYWGTGRRMDSKDWGKMNDYPGRNVLGIILTDVRKRLTRPEDKDPIRIDKINEMDTAQGMASIQGDHKRDPTREADPSIKENVNKSAKTTSEADPSIKENGNKSAKELAKNIHPTEIPCIRGGENTSPNTDFKTESARNEDTDLKKDREGLTNERDRVEGNKEIMTDNNQAKKSTDITVESFDQADPLLALIHEKLSYKQKSDIVESTGPKIVPSDEEVIPEMEEGWSVESISLGASALSEKMDINNATLTDGRIDKDKGKVLDWTLPSLNSSSLLEKSMVDMQKSLLKNGGAMMTSAQKPSAPSHSTPVATQGRKTYKAKRKSTAKNSTLNMLKDLDI